MKEKKIDDCYKIECLFYYFETCEPFYHFKKLKIATIN